MSKPEENRPWPSRVSTPHQRILACVLCQQRKVRCDRRSPCGSCVRAGAQCVAADNTRRRRRRFPERELLERLRRYEGLLRRNNIQFEPLHSSATATTTETTRDGGADQPDRPCIGKPGAVHETKNFWHLMDQMVRPEVRRRPGSTSNGGGLSDGEDNAHGDEDRGNGSGSSPCEDEQGAVIREAFDHEYGSSDHGFLFGARKVDADLATLHPSQVDIFRLWQIYLDNVNPLLKVTHTPTLQSRIIDAAGNVANIDPTMTALMFAIYCVATASLLDEECQTLFGLSRWDLLRSYQFGCQQALLNCGVVRSACRDSLTALYLCLISTRSCTDPRALCPALGVAFRIAQRMGLHSESANARHSPLEGEMRRRLWWSLIMFDNRICELSDQRTSMLIPTWDCRTPLNVNDFDLQSEMKVAPSDHNTPTEALFAVVRSELGNFVRNSDSHLDFTNPVLKPLAQLWRKSRRLEDVELPTFEAALEDKYLRHCNPENPLHFMAMWTARGSLAKCCLMDHHLRYSSVVQTDSQCDAAISYALRMLECDTKLVTSPLTKGYRWLLNFYFPLPAYLHIVQDLTKRPLTDHAARSWQAMSENYRARLGDYSQDSDLFFGFFSRIILQTWEAYRSRSRKGQPVEPPTIVADITHRLAERKPKEQLSDPEQRQGAASRPTAATDSFPTPMLMNIDANMLSFSMDGQSFAGPGLEGYPDMPGQPMMDLDLGLSDWNMADWRV